MKTKIIQNLSFSKTCADAYCLPLQPYSERAENFNKNKLKKVSELHFLAISYFVKSDDLSIMCSNSAKDNAPSSSKSASPKIF
jgi:hypothetical protein